MCLVFKCASRKLRRKKSPEPAGLSAYCPQLHVTLHVLLSASHLSKNALAGTESDLDAQSSIDSFV